MSLPNNIFQIKKKNDLSEILQSNNNIVTVMYSNEKKEKKEIESIKYSFLSLAKDNLSNKFIYIKTNIGELCFVKFILNKKIIGVGDEKNYISKFYQFNKKSKINELKRKIKLSEKNNKLLKTQSSQNSDYISHIKQMVQLLNFKKE